MEHHVQHWSRSGGKRLLCFVRCQTTSGRITRKLIWISVVWTLNQHSHHSHHSHHKVYNQTQCELSIWMWGSLWTWTLWTWTLQLFSASQISSVLVGLSFARFVTTSVGSRWIFLSVRPLRDGERSEHHTPQTDQRESFSQEPEEDPWRLPEELLGVIFVLRSESLHIVLSGQTWLCCPPVIGLPDVSCFPWALWINYFRFQHHTHFLHEMHFLVFTLFILFMAVYWWMDISLH